MSWKRKKDDILGRRNEGEMGKLARRLVCDLTSAWKRPGNRGLCQKDGVEGGMAGLEQEQGFWALSRRVGCPAGVGFDCQDGSNRQVGACLALFIQLIWMVQKRSLSRYKHLI